MKNILLACVLLFVIAIGLYLWFQSQDGGVEEDLLNDVVSQLESEGVVTAVDLSAVAADGPARITTQTVSGAERTIAVPSIALPLCAAANRIATPFEIEVGDYVMVTGNNESGTIVPCERESHYLTVRATVEEAAYGFATTYEKAPNGYVREEVVESEDPDFVYGFLLTDREEYDALQNTTEPREGPPTIVVRVYENTENLLPEQWVNEHAFESNTALALADPEEAVVGGAQAVHFIADGLYPISTYVVAQGSFTYLLQGAYLEPDSDIHEEFQTLVASFTFIPAES